MRRHLLCAGAIASLLLSANALAEECKPSQWGPDDELGSANLVTPERTLAAMKLVKQGKSMPLGIVIDRNTPAYGARYLQTQVVQPGQHAGITRFDYQMSSNDDMAQLSLGIGSQLDGLGHLGRNNTFYNCNQSKDFVSFTGLKKLGTHNVPPLIGRGIVLDMTRVMNKNPLDAGEAFNEKEIEQALKAQNLEIREGDIVLFYTGWTEAKLEQDPETWVKSEPGLGESGAAWLGSKNVMAVGADTWGVEPVPPEKKGRPFYGHMLLLKEYGIYLLETMNTGPLLREGVDEFMFVLGQARIRGTVQMIINPVAIY